MMKHKIGIRTKTMDLTGWNIRIMRHENTGIEKGLVWYGLHEVFYDEDGKSQGWDEEATITGDTPMEILEYLIICLRDFWKGRHDILEYDAEPEGEDIFSDIE